jgi:hypothetical protein
VTPLLLVPGTAGRAACLTFVTLKDAIYILQAHNEHPSEESMRNQRKLRLPLQKWDRRKGLLLRIFGIHSDRPESLDMRLQKLTSACSIVIDGLPIEEKQKLLRQLAHECGYVLGLESRVLEDSSATRYPDAEEKQMTIEFAIGNTGKGKPLPGM